MPAEQQRRADRWLERVRERKVLHRQRNRVYRVGFGLVGVMFMVAGAILTLPGVPGPGILLIAFGLAMLALEFDRAERLLERILKRIDKTSENVEQASPLQKALLAAAGVVAAAAVVAAAILWDIPLVPFV